MLSVLPHSTRTFFLNCPSQLSGIIRNFWVLVLCCEENCMALGIGINGRVCKKKQREKESSARDSWLRERVVHVMAWYMVHMYFWS